MTEPLTYVLRSCDLPRDWMKYHTGVVQVVEGEDNARVISEWPDHDTAITCHLAADGRCVWRLYHSGRQCAECYGKLSFLLHLMAEHVSKGTLKL